MQAGERNWYVNQYTDSSVGKTIETPEYITGITALEGLRSRRYSRHRQLSVGEEEF